MPPITTSSASVTRDPLMISLPPSSQSFQTSSNPTMPAIKESSLLSRDRPEYMNGEAYSLPQIETAIGTYSMPHSHPARGFEINSVQPTSNRVSASSVPSNQSAYTVQGSDRHPVLKGGLDKSLLNSAPGDTAPKAVSATSPRLQDLLLKHGDYSKSSDSNGEGLTSNSVVENSHHPKHSKMVTKTPSPVPSSSATENEAESKSTSSFVTLAINPALDTSRRRVLSNARNAEHVSYQFFHVEPCLYTHRMFTRAATIFKVLKDSETETLETKAARRRQFAANRGISIASIEVEKEKIPEMEFKDAHEQIKTFELTFAALKFQTLFRDILDRTLFFHEFSNFREDYSLVCIVLYDLQSRKFQRRQPFPDEELDEVCLEIEEALLSKKTRLLSTLAKERIKNNAPSLEYLLPEQVRDKDETKSKIPVYIWVNHFKKQMSEMIEELEADGFTKATEGTDLSDVTERHYLVDPHCNDLLTFPPHWAMYFKDSDWLKNGILVQQDKSSCLAPQSVQYVLGSDHDVIHVNVGTGMTTAHLASLLRAQSSHAHVWGFGVDGPERLKKVNKNLEMLGVKNTKILTEDFLRVDPEDPRFKNVKVVLITANCTKSAITSPVQFIVSEGEDMQILGELSKGEYDMHQLGERRAEHLKLITQALRFPKLQAVVYTTRSRYQSENEGVVNAAIDSSHDSSSKKMPFKVTPPVLPFMSDEIDSELNGVDGRFIRFTPSDKSNGCFVAVISKEPDDPKEVARSAIARAKSKGLLGKPKTSHGDVQNQIKTSNAMSDPTLHRKGGSGHRKSRKLKAAASAPEVKSEGSESPQRSRSMSTKSPAAIGARLYQAGLLAKLQQSPPLATPPKPEHVKVVKHPAPFR